MLDTFNEVLVQNFSRRHPSLATAFTKATPRGSAHPDYGNWLHNGLFTKAVPKTSAWLQQVHSARVAADLAHAKSKKGRSTKPVKYSERDQLARKAQAAWAELIREWKAIL
jgi:hypothetical protein